MKARWKRRGRQEEVDEIALDEAQAAQVTSSSWGDSGSGAASSSGFDFVLELAQREHGRVAADKAGIPPAPGWQCSSACHIVNL